MFFMPTVDIERSNKMTYIRLNKNANNLQDVTTYYQDRARQILTDGYIWCRECIEVVVDGKPVAAKTYFRKAQKSNPNYFDLFISLYIYESARGKGMFERVSNMYGLKHNSNKTPFVTIVDCNLERTFTKNRYSFVRAYPLANKSTEKHYNIISEVYGSRIAERSKIPYMNHVDEGIYILHNKLKVTDGDTVSAYMLHPIFQGDSDLATYGMKYVDQIDNKRVIMLAMEYRNIANAYLSFRQDVTEENLFSSVALSPIPEVNQMLVADKIQNYKDFVKAHKGTHPRSNELETYFLNWFKRLAVDMDFVTETINELQAIER